MCGIVFAINYGTNEEKVNDWIINQYQDQYNRGQKGFGLVAINEDKTYKILRATEPTKALFDLYNNESKALLFHHRIPTSSKNRIKQTHPIEIDNGSLKHKYLMIHNGTIGNHASLKEEHEELGFNYSTYEEFEDEYNDSEALAIELARYIEGQTDEMKIWSSAAFIMLQISKKKKKVERVFFGKTQQYDDLNLSKTRGKIRISSEGEGSEIKEKILYNFKLDDECKLEKSTIALTSYTYVKEEKTYWDKKKEENAVNDTSGDDDDEDEDEVKRKEWYNFEDIYTEAIEKVIDKGEEILTELVTRAAQEARDDEEFDMSVEGISDEFRNILTEMSNQVVKLRIDKETTVHSDTEIMESSNT